MPKKKDKALPLYEQLYESIRDDILSGKMREGEKLPSKRALAESRSVSVITVENAYSQLIAEGYVRARQRSGYYVQYGGERVSSGDEDRIDDGSLSDDESPEGSANAELFPFSVWTRLMRSVILEKDTALLQPVTAGGAMELRRAVSGYLYRARGFRQPPERIIIGAGTEYLYDLLIRLLGRDKRYGIEDPGFEKLPRIYALNGVEFEFIPLDGSGMSAAELAEKRIDVAHISPAHHFPTGIVMPETRRREILQYAENSGGFIIEDDYDSEFCGGGIVPGMFAMDSAGSVIYVNTFSRTIAPSVRISYMCLSEELYGLWRERLGFYACPVPAFEQYTLAKFIADGYFERHINRSRKRYKRIGELTAAFIMRFLGAEICEENNAGLHFTARIPEGADAVIEKGAECGIKITPLGEYYSDRQICPSDLYVVNYAGASEERLAAALKS
ncbi:MAG: PLP-dependent aminotransferase family protein [Oscillospiraceae bacterium]|nr:PLP-dependent aminotransferase family protein [Oscillospiraceae bacterium]